MRPCPHGSRGEQVCRAGWPCPVLPLAPGGGSVSRAGAGTSRLSPPPPAAGRLQGAWPSAEASDHGRAHSGPDIFRQHASPRARPHRGARPPPPPSARSGGTGCAGGCPRADTGLSHSQMAASCGCSGVNCHSLYHLPNGKWFQL